MVCLAGTALWAWSPVINSVALTKSAIMCRLLLTSTEEWSWGGGLSCTHADKGHLCMNDHRNKRIHAWMQTHGHRQTVSICAQRRHTLTHIHTSLKLCLLYLLYPTKPTRVLLQLEWSQNYSISHILNGPTSTLMVTHTHTLLDVPQRTLGHSPRTL